MISTMMMTSTQAPALHLCTKNLGGCKLLDFCSCSMRMYTWGGTKGCTWMHSMHSVSASHAVVLSYRRAWVDWIPVQFVGLGLPMSSAGHLVWYNYSLHQLLRTFPSPHHPIFMVLEWLPSPVLP